MANTATSTLDVMPTAHAAVVTDAVVAPVVSHVPAGWYSDPAEHEQLRWWNGSAWTERTATAPTTLPALTETSADDTADERTPDDAWEHVHRGRYLPGERGAALFTMEDAPDRWAGVAAWALALSPIVNVIALLFLTTVAWTPFWPLGIAALVVPVLWSVAFAARDRRDLLTWGYEHPAGLRWLLLGPLGYLAARTHRVRAEVGRGAGPLWGLGASVLVVAALGIVTPVTFAPSEDAQLRSQVVASEITGAIESDSMAKGAPLDVVCPPQVALTQGAQFVCNAVTDYGLAATVNVQLTDAEGAFTYSIASR